MALFQRAVLDKYLSGVDETALEEAWERFTPHFHNPEIQQNIRNSKEEEYQEGFLDDLFVKVLGYTKNPVPDYNLKVEQKNFSDSKKADGALLNGEKVRGVIELKGTDTTDLGKVETQAFGYKNKQPDAVYIIISNFEKLRFYIDNAVDYLEFNLFQLGKEDFKVLWLCLAHPNFAKGLPKKIKDASLAEEEDITKKLYKDYSAFKHDIFESIKKHNPEYDKLLLFRKTQKLLDRFLFIFFAEDRLLLPPNSIRKIIKQWMDLRDKCDEYVPLYERFKKYFGYMNEGHKGRDHEIFAYNGGLFAEDEILNSLHIDDDLLYKHAMELSDYNFVSEVDVNILGHIFEHSLNEIEEINAELEGKEVDSAKTRRKKDGVYYTPKYITQYIVEHTVGRLCEEKKEDLDIVDEEYRPNRRDTTKKPLLKKLERYREWLLQLTICDPACGSGAFLNQALEFLMNEHAYVDELQAKLLGESIVFPDVETSILEHNLFGVDINEESVEIAKLSLWLRTAQKGRKLTSLSSHIKCGNSLIDDPEVAGEKAFNWEEEFPDVFADGGFDVVIGNPPYGDYFTPKEKKYILKAYEETFSGTHDIYITFFEKGLKVTKSLGRLGFITPFTFIDYSQFSGIRFYLINNNCIEQLIKSTGVFDDAIVDTAITIVLKDHKQRDHYLAKSFTKKVKEINKHDLDEIESTHLTSSGFRLQDLEGLDIKSLKKDALKLGDLTKITQGITTGGNKCFLGSKESFLDADIPKEVIKKTLRGGDINKYNISFSGEYIIYSIKDMPDLAHKSIEQYLVEYKEKLSKKRETKQGKLPWYCLHWPRNEENLKEPKILIRQTASTIIAALDTESYYPIDSIHTINLVENVEDSEKRLRFLLGILNSKLMAYLYKWKLDEEGKVYPQVKKTNIEWLPIKSFTQNEKISSLTIKREEITETLLNVVQKFFSVLEANFSDLKASKNLQNWSELSFTEFLDELKKKNVNLSPKESAEWMEYFNQQKAKAYDLKSQIAQTDSEIDAMVYELYGLTEEKVAVVENASK